MTDEKKKMTAQGSSVGADDGQSISKIPRPLYQTRTKKTIPRKEIWRNFTEECAV